MADNSQFMMGSRASSDLKSLYPERAVVSPFRQQA
jgi:hypothetical protein